MPEQKFASRRGLNVMAVCLLFLFALGHAAGARAHAQQPAPDPERERAFRLFDESKFTEALPILEKLAEANPNDPAVLERLGFSLITSTQMVKDQGRRRLLLARARTALVRSQQLGNNSNLLKAALETLARADGSRQTFSSNKEADEAMHEGESAYVKGELDKAAASYERALKLDPQLYEAALFAGDMYFKKKEWDRAGEWFAKAVQLNPDRETAHRYWGDALMMGQGKREDSRQKFADAIVAEPYNRRAWVGLLQWGEKYKVQLSHPRIEPPTGVSPLKDNKMTITIDPKSLEKTDDGSPAWMFYGLTRASWATEKFAREFPNEKQYRHSLREEAEALASVAVLVKQQQKDGKVKRLDPMLENVVRLHDAGLIEAFVLLARPNEGIAQDYDTYRRANRDKLRRYLLEYVSSGK
ncbi:MAG: tetratricopeptide repeat protein [Acidobacteria bacterium]|nr:tetratricopeptide repeat protein [Acidobacteriota bacterium]